MEAFEIDRNIVTWAFANLQSKDPKGAPNNNIDIALTSL